MHKSVMVADRLLALAEKEGKTLTPMQLIKLVYIAHGWMLGIKGVPLISDRIEAWKYGPVIPALYQHVKSFRDQPVNGKLSDASSGIQFTPDEEHMIREVFRIYGARSGPELSRLTHEKESPWAQTFNPQGWGDQIPNDIIEDHYRRIYKERQS